MTEDLMGLYNDFAHEVAHEYRYSLSPKSLVFLEDLLKLARANVHSLSAGGKLFRARVNGFETETNEPSTTPMSLQTMKPIRNVVSEGRANPSNICVLYLAGSIGTALSEVRPSVEYPVTVGTFLINRDLRLVDLSSVLDLAAWAKQTKPLWLKLSNDFSKPLNPKNQNVHYAKTQIIAETFKRDGFDGIRYRSQFFSHETIPNPEKISGMNYALFDLDSADCVERQVFKITEQHMVYEKVHD